MRQATYSHRITAAARRSIKNSRGVTLIELLIALVIIVLATICALSFFVYGKGNIEKQGNRRAALELARSRLEELMDANSDVIKPPDATERWLRCTGSPCTWSLFAARVTETVTVNGKESRVMETKVKWSAPATGSPTSNLLEVDVRVWFTAGSADDNFHRVFLRTLRNA